MACRVHYVNRVAASGTTISASSYQTSLPPSWVADQLRSKVWRSKPGYNVVSGLNDRVPFDATSASLTPGNYSTPALYAAQVQAALLAAGLTGATCTYDSGTGKFTLAASGAFTLPWLTGSDVDRSAGKDLGFDTSADDGSAASHVADSASYHSREWLLCDFGAAVSAQFAVCVDHNFSATASVSLQMNATDAWISPSVDEALTIGDELALKSLTAEVSYRYARILIEDVANDDGYSEMGVLLIGPRTQPTVNYSQGFELDPDDLSRPDYADQGAHYVDLGQQRNAWRLQWEDLEPDDRDALWAVWETCPVGVCFAFTFDTADELDTTFWVSMPAAPRRPHSVGDYWNLQIDLQEALG